MKAWNGATAEGLPDSGMILFASSRSPEEYVAVAWLLEEGTRRFYKGVSELVPDPEAVILFRKLALAEEHHQVTLAGLYTGFTGKEPGPDFPRSAVPDLRAEKLTEGGMHLDEALLWADGKQTKAILELAITMEANAYDRYLFMEQHIEDPEAREVFQSLSNEERLHLNRLTDLFDTML